MGAGTDRSHLDARPLVMLGLARAALLSMSAEPPPRLIPRRWASRDRDDLLYQHRQPDPDDPCANQPQRQHLPISVAAPHAQQTSRKGRPHSGSQPIQLSKRPRAGLRTVDQLAERITVRETGSDEQRQRGAGVQGSITQQHCAENTESATIISAAGSVVPRT